MTVDRQGNSIRRDSLRRQQFHGGCFFDNSYFFQRQVIGKFDYIVINSLVIINVKQVGVDLFVPIDSSGVRIGRCVKILTIGQAMKLFPCLDRSALNCTRICFVCNIEMEWSFAIYGTVLRTSDPFNQGISECKANFAYRCSAFLFPEKLDEPVRRISGIRNILVFCAEQEFVWQFL